MARLVRTVTPHGNYCTCIRRNSASSSVEQTLSYFLYYHYSLCFHAPDSLALSALHCICRNCDLVQAHILIWQDHVFFSPACFVSSAFKSLSEACKFHYSAHLQHGFLSFHCRQECWVCIAYLLVLWYALWQLFARTYFGDGV